jgi:small acid-soluble spore protein P (minor)
MTKPRAYPILPDDPHQDEGDRTTMREPLSGSKKVKNRNHSRHNHGEGS